jgi:hypothetical protein
MSAIRTASAVVVAATLLVSGCAASDDAVAPSAPATERPSVPTGTPDAGSPTATTTSERDSVEVEIAVDGKQVTPAPARTRVPKGATVRLVVTSDVANELHVHGYELYENLPAGRAATVEFIADQAGLFEVETHEDPVLVLTQLQVQ